MKKVPVVLLCGIGVMLLTIVVYFAILSSFLLRAIHFIALVAILLSEGITTAYACTAKGSPRKVAATVVSGLVIPYSVIISVVYIIGFPNGYGAYIGWYLAGLIAANIIALILAHTPASDVQFQEAKSNMLYMRKTVKCIMAEETAVPYQAELRALEEKLHFTNDNVIAAEDENILNMLMQLQNNIADPDFDTKQWIAQIAKAVDRRTIMTSRNA